MPQCLWYNAIYNILIVFYSDEVVSVNWAECEENQDFMATREARSKVHFVKSKSTNDILSLEDQPEW